MSSGSVKWFDPQKGFGFIESAGSPDLFVHVSALPYGELLAEGDQVEFDVEQGQRGPNAIGVQIVSRSGNPIGSRRAPESPVRTRIVSETELASLPLKYGTIVRLVEEKGFGFIQPDDDQDQVFFHRSASPEPLRAGDRVEFRLGRSPKGLRAEAVRLI